MLTGSEPVHIVPVPDQVPLIIKSLAQTSAPEPTSTDVAASYVISLYICENRIQAAKLYKNKIINLIVVNFFCFNHRILDH